jgi:hypothetical protein
MAMDRKSSYLWLAESAVPYLKEFQCMEATGSKRGCFFYPYWKGGAVFANPRWQEAVLTLAWLWKKKRVPLRDRVEAGIDFWCGQQNSDGSFPEHFSGERSFSATAFSTLAVAEAAKIVGLKSSWKGHLEMAGMWLAKNDETIMTNQEACAAVALLCLSRLLRNKRFEEEAERKLAKVLRNQSREGHFLEKCGCDIGYSSLTLEMLGLYHLMQPQEAILASAGRFVGFFNDVKVDVKKNSRGTDWIILDGFEIFAEEIPAAKVAISGIMKGGKYDFVHLPDERHFCTDAYRHCWGCEHAGFKTNVDRPAFRQPKKTIVKNSLFHIHRRIGIHKIRRLKYMWCFR